MISGWFCSKSLSRLNRFKIVLLPTFIAFKSFDFMALHTVQRLRPNSWHVSDILKNSFTPSSMSGLCLTVLDCSLLGSILVFLPCFISPFSTVIAAVLSYCCLSSEIASAVLTYPLNSDVWAHVAGYCFVLLFVAKFLRKYLYGTNYSIEVQVRYKTCNKKRVSKQY